MTVRIRFWVHKEHYESEDDDVFEGETLEEAVVAGVRSRFYELGRLDPVFAFARVLPDGEVSQWAMGVEHTFSATRRPPMKQEKRA